MSTVKARAQWIENIRSIVDNTRTHSIVLDVSQESGGNDTGPTALELSLMSLAGCALTVFVDIAKKSKIPLSKAEVEVEGEKIPGSSKLSKVNMKVHIAGKARQQLFEAAWRRTEATCPVLYVFREPIPVGIESEIISEQ